MAKVGAGSEALAALLKTLQQLKKPGLQIEHPASRIAKTSATMARLARHYEPDRASPSSTPSTDLK